MRDGDRAVPISTPDGDYDVRPSEALRELRSTRMGIDLDNSVVPGDANARNTAAGAVLDVGAALRDAAAGRSEQLQVRMVHEAGLHGAPVETGYLAAWSLTRSHIGAYDEAARELLGY